MKKNTAIALALGAGLTVGLFSPVRAQNLGDILKGGAIILAVDKFGGEIDRFVNKLLGDPSKDGVTDTKVVPILSIGKGTYAGAAQVTGPRALVQTVRAVAQVEGDANIGVRLRAKGFIPISDRSVRSADSLKRVNGCAVSGFIDVKL